MVDRTVYADEAHTSKIALRQIFGRMGLPQALCRSAADGGLLSVEIFAMLGDTAQAVKTSLRTMIAEADLGTTDAARELALMQLAAVWHACHALQGQFATRRARMEEDPNKVPEMAQEDHAEFRARFVQAHPDVILLDANEPHKKFVEKLSRDFLVQGMVPYYSVAEIRTRSDSIVQKSGLSKNAEDLLTISKADEPDQVTDSMTMMNRIHAFFMALEYLNICTYSRAAGPLRYLQELEQFRSECPGLPYLLAADSLIRKKVNRLQAEQRQLYGTFEDAIIEVLNNHKYLWNDARTKAVLAKVDRRREDASETSDPQDKVVEAAPKSSPHKDRKKRQRLRNKALLREARESKVKKDPSDKKSASARDEKVSKDKRIPDTEWKAIVQAASSVSGPKRCHYFNSTMGCSVGDKCRFKHQCMVCGSAHSMVGNHWMGDQPMAPLDEAKTVDSNHCSNVFPSPFWGSGFVPPGTQFFVEIFAGEAGLTQAIIARGIKTLPPIEILGNDFVADEVDILDPKVFQHLCKLIRAGCIFFIHFGTPCSSFSQARKDDGGPPPLRDRHNLWGRPKLSQQDQVRVELGNQFMELTTKLLVLCCQFGVHWSLENPASSFLWAMPPVRALAARAGVSRFILDMCRFQSKHKKPTALLSDCDLSALALACDQDVRPHVHEPLVGMVMSKGKKIFRTKLAQVYPPLLCQAWARVIACLQADPLAATFQMAVPAHERKRPLGQPLPWVVHKQRATAEKARDAGYQLKRSALPPLLQVEMEPGQAVQQALQVPHPFTLDPALDPDLQEALAFAVHKPRQLLGHRQGALQFWADRAERLLPLTDQELRAIHDPYLRSLLRGAPDDQPAQLGTVTHVALWRELLAASRCIDSSLVDEMINGFSIVGDIKRSYRLISLAAITAAWWCSAGTRSCFAGLGVFQQGLEERKKREFSNKVLRNVKRSEVTENTSKIWKATMEDVREGVTAGPFFSKDEVDKFLGTVNWIPTQRFEVVQKNKVRGVDSATINGINMASRILEKIELPSTDTNVSALRWMRSSCSSSTKQWRWSVISLREPDTGKVSFFIMIGHSFGLVAAVYNYNRRSAAITDILRRVFFVAAFNFYDDKYGFETEVTCSSAFEVAQKVHWWLGAKFDPKKLQLCEDPTILGVTYDLKAMCLKIKPSRKEELLDEIKSIISSEILSPGQAGKLRGKLMFGASQLWGKIGRAFLRALSERQYTRSPKTGLNLALKLALKQWELLIDHGPPRPITASGARPADYVIFTDGSFPDQNSDLQDPWIGGVLFKKGARPIQFGCKVGMDLIEKWIPRKSQIAMIELFATVVALQTFKPWISGSWSLLFVDSEPVQGALVKGYSAREDLCELVGVFWQLALEIHINLYIDRVPTDSNPADPPSRGRLDIGQSLGWDTISAVFPEL